MYIPDTRIKTKLSSIIIPCKNEGPNVKMTVDSILEASSCDDPEIIAIDDGSNDGCCNFLKKDDYSRVRLITSPGVGAARARNLGAAASRGEYLVFCDAHITVPEGWLDCLLENFDDNDVDGVSPAIGSLENPSAAGYGQTWNERLEVTWLPPPPDFKVAAAPLLPGGCLAVRSAAFFQVGGFDGGFIVWGHEDVELSLKLWLFGCKLYVMPSVKILHLFRKKHPYPVQMDHVYYNLLRMAYSHLSKERINKVRALIKPSGLSKTIEDRVLKAGAMKQRNYYLRRRNYDDDWFMNKFGIPF